MFAQLGDIKFELITYFNGWDETVSYNYVQHERIENKPVLQYVGKNLLEENIRLNFHRSFCVPEDELKNIIEVADKITPLKFIKGNGEYIGVFVIEEIGKTTEQSNPNGQSLWLCNCNIRSLFFLKSFILLFVLRDFSCVFF